MKFGEPDPSTVDSDFYWPGGEPFFMRGGEVGCLLVHGITASPQEMRWLGDYLAGQGHTVYGVRLFAHGRHVHDMRRVMWWDWYGSVLDGYTILRQQCEKVFVIGLSMGGLLSLHLGTREQPDGVVSLAGPVEVDEPLLPLARYLKHVWRYTRYDRDEVHEKIDVRMRGLQAARGERVIGRQSYGQHAIAGAAALHGLMQTTRANLNRLTAPLQLVYSTQDETVPFRNMALIEQAVGTPPEDIHTLKLEHSSHLLTLDEEMDTVFDAVGNFVARYAKAAAG